MTEPGHVAHWPLALVFRSNLKDFGNVGRFWKCKLLKPYVAGRTASWVILMEAQIRMPAGRCG
jgi:hypothetical protein